MSRMKGSFGNDAKSLLRRYSRDVRDCHLMGIDGILLRLVGFSLQNLQKKIERKNVILHLFPFCTFFFF